MLKLTFPLVLFTKKNIYFEGSGVIAFPFIILWFMAVIGWFMNFQNLWQHFPVTNKIGDAGFEWLISIVGIFIPPVGGFTGWLY